MPRRTELAAILLLCVVGTALAWGAASSPWGLLGTSAGLVAAWGLARGAGSRGPPRHLARAAVGVAVAWLGGYGLAAAGPSVAAARVPLLVLCVVLAAALVQRLAPADVELVLRGLIVLGTLHAVVVLGQAVGVVPGMPAPFRATSLLGHPNATGVFLVSCAMLTVRELARSGSRWHAGLLVLQGLAVLLTGSRAALLLATLTLLWLAAHRRRWRLPALLFVATGALVTTFRLRQWPEERPLLWRQVVAQVGEHPWLGWGPQPRLLTAELPGLRPTTHAHNEILQLTLEYGLVGLVLLAASAGGWLVGRRLRDPWSAAAAAALAASGLVDITLRFPPLALVLGVLLAAATVPRTSRPVRGTDARAGPSHATEMPA